MAKRQGISFLSIILIGCLLFGVFFLLDSKNESQEKNTDNYTLYAKIGDSKITKDWCNLPLTVSVSQKIVVGYSSDIGVSDFDFDFRIETVASETTAFFYKVDNEIVKYDNGIDVTACFDITKSGNNIVLTPPSDLIAVLEELHQGSEVVGYVPSIVGTDIPYFVLVISSDSQELRIGISLIELSIRLNVNEIII